MAMGFINVLKDRYRDKMCELREESKEKARAEEHVIRHDEHKFDIISNYPLDKVPLERWQRWCKARIWNTDKWLKISKAGRKNSQNDLSRHTGGSMGFDEHRIRLEKQKGGLVSYEFVFIDTHATKRLKRDCVKEKSTLMTWIS